MNYEGFEELEELGFISEYVEIDHKNGITRPMFNATYLLESGFYPKDSKLTYLDENGYEYDRECISKLGISKGDVLTVKTCSVGSSMSYYTFKEISGQHNTVMFEKVST